MPRPDALVSLARCLLPSAIKLAGVDPEGVKPRLHPAEVQATLGMTRARRREFAAGRLAARLALAELGLQDEPVRVGHDRAPIWPAGMVGSITHTQVAAIAAAAPAATVVSIGIDLEAEEAVDAALEADVLTRSERDWVAEGGWEARARLRTVAFSAKEAAYKCIHPIAGKLIDFHAIEIRLGPGCTGFTARFRTDVAPFRPNDALTGRMGWSSGHVFTVVAIPRRPSSRGP